MDFNDLVTKRYSIREYLPTPVPEDVLHRIMEAARQAPSACNLQPWHFYVIQDEKTRLALFPPEHQQWLACVPVIVVACSVPEIAWVRIFDGKNHADIDLAIAMEHIVLAATAEGLGSCWICAFNPEHVRRTLNLPLTEEPVALTPIGYHQTIYRPHQRKAFDDIITWC